MEEIQATTTITTPTVPFTCSICCREIGDSSSNTAGDDGIDGSEEDDTTATDSVVQISQRCGHQACRSCLKNWYFNTGNQQNQQRERQRRCLFCRLDLTNDEVSSMMTAVGVDESSPCRVGETTMMNNTTNNQHETTLADDLTADWIRSHTRQCQNCGSYIQKEDGTCDKMECLCGHRFCFSCGEQVQAGSYGRLRCNCSPSNHYFYNNIENRTNFNRFTVVIPTTPTSVERNDDEVPRSMVNAPTMANQREKNKIAKSILRAKRAKLQQRQQQHLRRVNNNNDDDDHDDDTNNSPATEEFVPSLGLMIKIRKWLEDPNASAKRERRSIRQKVLTGLNAAADDNALFLNYYLPETIYGSWLFHRRGLDRLVRRIESFKVTPQSERQTVAERRLANYRNKRQEYIHQEKYHRRLVIHGKWLFQGKYGYKNLVQQLGGKRLKKKQMNRLVLSRTKRKRSRFLRDINHTEYIEQDMTAVNIILRRHGNNWIFLDPVDRWFVLRRMEKAYRFPNCDISPKKAKWYIV